ncbi:Ornithine carbamoyltransferase [Aquisphaera giovannonii]|uniref:Ornithine carbamoyltransferase n=1 Tax=Aquisphaera giovannonii TaxID=406548 RepID=A0A5B9W793_9BACT|nr:ornithine carbamoyltransferase [Aquisphaera giovannonii]QEH36423.1 Ornithine carbamoyltransferase [Aquisphaera giovannonii]
MSQEAKGNPRAFEVGPIPAAGRKRKNGFSAADRRGVAGPSAEPKGLRHFVSLFDVAPAEVADLIERTVQLKADATGLGRASRLQGRTLGLLFEKPSLRTRVSFETAMARLGGASIFLRGKDVGLGVRESVADFARVISQYVDFLAIRTFSQSIIEELARHASVPVINALSDYSHPCQAMADMVTILEERGDLAGKKIVFVGDGNNVARSLAMASAHLGVEFVLTAPEGYEFPESFAERFAAKFPETPLGFERNPAKAVKGADVVYTDVWASMGQEQEADQRREVFAPYQVNEALFAKARPDAIFLHCLPAHRGEEVTSGVLDDPRSKVIPQAANRMHFQMALLLWLLERRGA